MFIKMTDTNGTERIINDRFIVDFRKSGNYYHVGTTDFGFDISTSEMKEVEKQLEK